MKSPTRVRTTLSATLCALWLAAPAPAGAEGHEAADVAAQAAADGAEAAASSWDQEKAIAAAGELAAAVDGLQDALRKEPKPMGLAPGTGERSRFELRDELRLMESEARHLQLMLQDGKGRDETYPVFRRVDEIRRDAVVKLRRMFLQKPVLDQIETARGPLQTLADLYGVTLERKLETR